MKNFRSEELQNFVMSIIVEGTLGNILVDRKEDFSTLLPFILKVGDDEYCYYMKADREYDYKLLLYYIAKRKK